MRLTHVFSEVLDLTTLREILGVEVGKLKTYGNLNQFAIKPALLEVNALAEFEVTITPEKTGRRVTGVRLGWSVKDISGRKAAYAELQRPRVGRAARISGRTEDASPPCLLE